MPKFKDYTGERFGRLKAVKFSRREGNQTYWILRCDCGATVEKLIRHCVGGGIKSCGCLVVEHCCTGNALNAEKRKALTTDDWLFARRQVKRGLSQKQVAQQIGVHPVTLSRYLSKKILPKNNKSQKDAEQRNQKDS